MLSAGLRRSPHGPLNPAPYSRGPPWAMVGDWDPVGCGSFSSPLGSPSFSPGAAALAMSSLQSRTHSVGVADPGRTTRKRRWVTAPPQRRAYHICACAATYSEVRFCGGPRRDGNLVLGVGPLHALHVSPNLTLQRSKPRLNLNRRTPLSLALSVTATHRAADLVRTCGNAFPVTTHKERRASWERREKQAQLEGARAPCAGAAPLRK